jgi:hypothetical protein
MNLFSRLSELLDTEDRWFPLTQGISRSRVDNLVAIMEKYQERVRQSAVTLIAAERAVGRELDSLRSSGHADRVMLDRLLEEQDRSSKTTSWMKRTLLELRAGLRHARSLRATARRWQCVTVSRRATAGRRLFWKAYDRLCDLADGQMDSLENENTRHSIGSRTSQAKPVSGQ